MNYEDFFSTSYLSNDSSFWMPERDCLYPDDYDIYISEKLAKENINKEFLEWPKLRDQKNFEYTERIFEFLDSDLMTVIRFLEHHFTRYHEKNGDKRSFLFFIQEMLPKFKQLTESRKNTVLAWLDEKRYEIKNNLKSTHIDMKITWNGSPAQFGYLFLELVKHGFIEPPLYNGEMNYTGLSRLCNNYFDIETTSQNLTKEMNPEKNTLSDTKRAKFTIPNLSDLL